MRSTAGDTLMSQSQNHITRREFIQNVITTALPIVLSIAVLALAFFVYDIADSPNGGYKLLLLILLLATFAYPALKRRYGQRLWHSLTPSVRRVLLVLRIVALLLEVCLWLLLGLYMPLLLVLVCIKLMIENYRLHRALGTLAEKGLAPD